MLNYKGVFQFLSPEFLANKQSLFKNLTVLKITLKAINGLV